jgi:Phosphate-starvation-inducible E family
MTPGWTSSVRLLVAAERAVFSFVGVLFFVAAFALAVRATGDLWTLVAGPHESIIAAGTAFLDVMLLVLMMVELAYTVTVSLRGTVLAAEPFLIVGLIAVIRRMLVITIGDVTPGAATTVGGGVASQPVELGILTGVVLVLVVSIVLLRLRPRLRDEHDAVDP